MASRSQKIQEEKHVQKLSQHRYLYPSAGIHHLSHCKAEYRIQHIPCCKNHEKENLEYKSYHQSQQDFAHQPLRHIEAGVGGNRACIQYRNKQKSQRQHKAGPDTHRNILPSEYRAGKNHCSEPGKHQKE